MFSAATSAQDSLWWQRLNTPTAPAYNDWNNVAFNGTNTFAMVGGTNNKSAYSTTGGQTWTVGTLPSTGYRSMIYGDKFVTVGDNGVGAYSTDGITWTACTGLPSLGYYSVAYGASGYVAVGTTTSGSATTTYATSSDGITWSSKTFASGLYSCVGYGAGLYMAWTLIGTVYVSSDLITWTLKAAGQTASIRNIAYGAGYWVGVQDIFGITQGTITWSTDSGGTWSTTTAYNTNFWYKVQYANNQFVITGGDFGGTKNALYATNPAGTWTYSTLPQAGQWLGLAYGQVSSQPRWVTAGYYSPGNVNTSLVSVSSTAQLWN